MVYGCGAVEPDIPRIVLSFGDKLQLVGLNEVIE